MAPSPQALTRLEQLPDPTLIRTAGITVSCALPTEASGRSTLRQHGTLPKSINKSGAITGYYKDVNDILHGFLRATNGSMTSFNAPVPSTAPFPPASTHLGRLSTTYDDHFIGHGFLRAPDGTITTFDVPGAISTTSITGGNDPKQYSDEHVVNHGFVHGVRDGDS